MKLQSLDPLLLGTTGVGCIHLSTGRLFNILDPDPALIEPEMLAHALGFLCRWTGQCNVFFSVAQHCVIVSEVVPPELALQGLLHDASEAFIGDINRPLKDLMHNMAPGVLQGIEERLHEAIAERFGTGYPHDPLVKWADNTSLATEKRDILTVKEDWHSLPDPLTTPIRPLGPVGARNAWLTRFRKLTER